MFLNGAYYPNVTCSRCRRRHPAEWSCMYAATVAADNRPAQPEPEPTLEERVEALEEANRKLRIALRWRGINIDFNP